MAATQTAGLEGVRWSVARGDLSAGSPPPPHSPPLPPGNLVSHFSFVVMSALDRRSLPYTNWTIHKGLPFGLFIFSKVATTGLRRSGLLDSPYTNKVPYKCDGVQNVLRNGGTDGDQLVGRRRGRSVHLSGHLQQTAGRLLHLSGRQVDGRSEAQSGALGAGRGSPSGQEAEDRSRVFGALRPSRTADKSTPRPHR